MYFYNLPRISGAQLSDDKVRLQFELLLTTFCQIVPAWLQDAETVFIRSSPRRKFIRELGLAMNARAIRETN